MNGRPRLLLEQLVPLDDRSNSVTSELTESLQEIKVAAFNVQ